LVELLGYSSQKILVFPKISDHENILKGKSICVRCADTF
jgi:hypothetical protein